MVISAQSAKEAPTPTQISDLRGVYHGTLTTGPRESVCSIMDEHGTYPLHDSTQGASGLGIEDSIPLFTLKYGNVLVPVHGERSDYHVEDLAFAFQDPQFVKGVVNNAKI